MIPRVQRIEHTKAIIQGLKVTLKGLDVNGAETNNPLTTVYEIFDWIKNVYTQVKSESCSDNF